MDRNEWSKHDFEPKKKFGQNFISDPNLLLGIVSDANVTKADEILEIGPGAGTMTAALADHAKKVVAVEIDQSLQPILKEALKDKTNCTILYADFMKLSAEEINQYFSGSYKVVANLPYYITSPILFKILEEGFKASSLTLMVQKEVADRLIAPSGTKDYGAITAQLNSVADVTVARQVNRTMFYPRPTVDSAVVQIELRRNKYPIQNIVFHREVIKTAFSMRRKTLANCLKSRYNLSAEQLLPYLEQEKLPPQVRGEVLSSEQFVRLSNYLLTIVK